MTVFAVLALLLTASPVTHSTLPAAADASARPGVIVKLGTPSLEEYQHGDPADRVQLTDACQSTH